MSTSNSVGRSASTPKKDRSRLCAFTFADGRQCRTPRCSGHLHLCYFHAQKEAERLAAKQVGEDISRFLPAKLLTACDLSGAMARVFCAIARGDVKPKLASTLAYLSQSMVQSIPIARHEYCEAFGTNAWRRQIRSSFNVPAPQPKPAPQPAPKPAPPARPPAPQPTPQPTPQPASQPNQPAVSALRTNLRSESPQPHPAQPPVNCRSLLATPHSPLPQSPHKPLPPTGAEFAQQVLAGLPTASLPATPHVQPPPPNPRRAETHTNCHSERSEESAFSSSSAPSTTPAPASPPQAPPASSSSDSAPARTSSTQPAPSSPCTLPTPVKSQPAPTPHAPPPVPPGFGAPANWDVLIPPKPRRRFSRHWQLHE